jgi:homoserine dehydrogenase
VRHDIIVLKFGSSVLRTATDLPAVVHEIYRWYREGWRVCAVVSAFGETTEQLLKAARDLVADPNPHATAELLATGERQSAALLAIALDRVGVPARLADPRAIGLTAAGHALDSEPVDVDGAALATLLDEFSVLVVPGFFGYSANGQLHLFGRGGSDLSAVYLATALQANRCRLIKDVDGVYEFDPAAATEPCDLLPRRYAALNYQLALERAAPLIQAKAVQCLARTSASAEVAGLASPYESTVGPSNEVLVERTSNPPVSVLLLGLGTVGLGAYQRMLAMPEHFSVVGALVRDRAKYVAHGIPERLLHESVHELANLYADIVVDALPGLDHSHTFVRQCLARGIRVVTANKALVAEAGPALAAVALRHGASIAYSAAVGGCAPMIEAVRREARHGEIRCIAGVLNGTCNHVLDRCAEGVSFSAAIHEAHDRGFAEADATEDLSGNDAGRKLRILCRHAFGQDLAGIALEPLNAATYLRMHAALRPDETLRIIARAWKLGTRVLGQVRPEAVSKDDPFASVRGEWNRLTISRADGKEVIVSGRGAGRWPTTEAVIADLLEVARERRRGQPAHAVDPARSS